MKGVFALAMFSLIVTLAACQGTGAHKQGTHDIITTLPVSEFDKKIAAIPDVQLVDVRSPEEYSEGHLPNAVNIDVNSGYFSDVAAKLDTTKPVMVYCYSGKRSARAAGELADMGFKKIYNLDGGISAWGEKGMPIVTSPK